MSKRHGLTSRVRYAIEYFERRTDRNKPKADKSVFRPNIPGNPSCKKVKGIVSFQKEGSKPCIFLK